MDLGHDILEHAAVHALLVQDVLLVITGIVAEFAAGGRFLVTLFAEECPARPVVTVPVLAHERVVEVTKVQVQQFFLFAEGRVFAVGCVDGDEPGRFLEPLVHLGQELCLELLGREGLTVDILAVIDMVLGPMAKSGLHEGEAGILVVTLGETAVEFHMEAPQFLAAPVGILRVLSGPAVGLGPNGFIAVHFLDIVRHGAGVTRIGVAEAHHGLMPAGGHLLQQLVHGRPVEHILLLADIVVQHVGILQLHVILFHRTACVPQHNTRHGLYVRDGGLQGDADGLFNRLGVGSRVGTRFRSRLLFAGAGAHDQGQQEEKSIHFTPG